jgi:hypothetical protein
MTPRRTIAHPVAVTFIAIVAAMVANRADAQTASFGTLRVTVADATGAVIVGARVTVTRTDESGSGVPPASTATGDDGVAVVHALVPGRYTVDAEFPGFETRHVPDILVRPGDNRQLVPLAIEGLTDSVVVQQDAQVVAADPRGPAFGTDLSRDQIEALSDDPDTMRQQLLDLAGPGAIIKVDSFEGGALPAKVQIRSIRISRDQFAAENHSAGGTQIEIITQPGVGPLRFSSGFKVRDGAWDGRSPFVPVKGPEQNRTAVISGMGTLIKNKSSFNFFIMGVNGYDTPNINVAVGDHLRSEALNLTAPHHALNVNAQVDYALALNQTLRLAYVGTDLSNGNQGIGAFDEEERGYSTAHTTETLRLQHTGPLGRRMFARTRLQLGWSDAQSQSNVEAITVRVLDAFTQGGAQVAGGQHSRTIGLASDIDYVRGMHTIRTGFAVDGGRWRSDNNANYLGTYTFDSLAAFQAGRPQIFTRRIGDPSVRYENWQTGIYAQDDIRILKSVTVSAGLRYEVQTHVQATDAFGPRLGVTAAPFRDGRTTLRASWSRFFDWLPTDTYEQSLRLDGLEQQEVVVPSPTFPVPPVLTAAAEAGPVNRYLLGPGFGWPVYSRVSLGIDQRVFKKLQASVLYSHLDGVGLARGVNLNAPIDGRRANPAAGNLIDATSDGQSRERQLQINITANPGALAPSKGPVFAVNRTTLFLNYTLARIENDTDGAFVVSPSGRAETEWGPAPNDIGRRFNATLNSQMVKNLLMGVTVSTQSGAPYTITSGHDDNGDQIFNDRPEGIGRNSARGAPHVSVTLRFGYTIPFGRATLGDAFDHLPRYRVQWFLEAQNLSNHANYAGYSGVLTSPFFGQPTTVGSPRKVDAGINVNF